MWTEEKRGRQKKVAVIEDTAKTTGNKGEASGAGKTTAVELDGTCKRKMKGEAVRGG